MSFALLPLCVFPPCEQSFNLFLAAYHFINQTFLPGPGSSPKPLSLFRGVHSSASIGFCDGQPESGVQDQKTRTFYGPGH